MFSLSLPSHLVDGIVQIIAQGSVVFFERVVIAIILLFYYFSQMNYR